VHLEHVPILSQLRPVPTATSNFLKIHLNAPSPDEEEEEVSTRQPTVRFQNTVFLVAIANTTSDCALMDFQVSQNQGNFFTCK
jgi:hypothetical protein